MRSREANQGLCRIALLLIWMVVLTPVYSANALQIQFNPDSDVRVTDISADINWTTDEESSGKLYFGVQEPGEEESSGTGRTDHSVSITGIAPETTFRFFIEAKNATDTVRSPADEGSFYSFTTDEPWDRTPPRPVKSLASPTVLRDSVTLTWEPDEGDDDIDYYMVFRDDILLDDELVEASYTDHGLNFSTGYTYRVMAVDTSGNYGSNSSLDVTTRSESYQPVVISDLQTEVLGTNIYVTWTTNIESHSRVRYSQNPLLLDSKKEDPDMATEHEIVLSGMPENSEMTLRAESCTAAGACGNSSAVTVQTSEEIELMLDVDGMDCSLDTPEYVNTNRIDVKGIASPGADVEVYMNGQRERFKRVTATAEFLFSGVDLDPDRTENEIRITASDGVAPDKVCVERVLLDYYTPEVNFSNETLNLSFSDTEMISIKGSVFDDHAVTMYAYVQSVDDTIAPSAPANLNATDVKADSITISWEAAEDDDIHNYIIYRSDVPDGPIASAEPESTGFTDDQVSASTTYTYEVSAVDNAGNEGPRSSPVSITTLPDGSEVGPRRRIAPPNPSLKLTKEYATTDNSVDFSESIGPLIDGNNIVRLVFVDDAGNSFERQFEVYLDKEPPAFISPSAAEIQTKYSPSYVSDVLISGQINKPGGKVLAWVNTDTGEKPTYTFSVGENGTFEAELSLSTTIGAAISGALRGDIGPGTASMQEGAQASGPSVTREGTPNKVVLIAVDDHGRRSAPLESMIEYNPCGQNYYWSVEYDFGGNILNTRELIEGVAAYGFGFKLKWIGGGDASKAKVAGKPNVVRASVGTEESKKYDSDWIRGITVMCKNPSNCTEGFVLINLNPPDVPEGKTYYEMENNLSKHRKGECWPLVGCIRLLLEMQIDSDPGPFMAQYSGSGAGVPPVGVEQVRQQRQCVQLNVQLDQRVNPSRIPKSLLNGSIRFIDEVALPFIEDFVEPVLEWAGKAVLAGCLLGHLAKFAMKFWTSMECKWSSTISGLGSVESVIRTMVKGNAIEIVGRMHDVNDKSKSACYVEFPSSNDDKKGNKQAREACIDCANAIDSEKKITDTWHMFCDRMMCPSVPSLQHYIRSKWKGGKKTDFSDMMGTAAGGVVRDFAEGEAAKAAQETTGAKDGDAGGAAGQAGAPSADGCTIYDDGKVKGTAGGKAIVLYGCGNPKDWKDNLWKYKETDRVVTNTVISAPTQNDLSKKQYFVVDDQGYRIPKTKAGPAQVFPSRNLADEYLNAWQKLKTANGDEICRSKGGECMEGVGKSNMCWGEFAAPAIKCVGASSGSSSAQTCASKGQDYKCIDLNSGVSPIPKKLALTDHDSRCFDLCKGGDSYVCCDISEDKWKGLKIVGSAVTDINSESSNLPTVEEQEPELNMITGMAGQAGQASGTDEDKAADRSKELDDKAGAAGSGGDAGKTAAKEGKSSKCPTVEDITGEERDKLASSDEPDYKTVLSYADYKAKYAEDTDLYSKFKDITSDCQLADLGQEPVKEMFKFYEEHKDDKIGKMCMSGHVPQPACCPFEYMQEWGWGMLFNNELEESYCLGNPEDEDHCGPVQEIVNGVTGICNPEGDSPQSTFEILDGLTWVPNEGYPAYPDEMIGRDVYYLMEFNKDGSFKKVNRGYLGRGIKKASEEQETGKIEITTGQYFIPDHESTTVNMVEWFPSRSNADLSDDEVCSFENGLNAFAKDLKEQFENGVIQFRGNPKAKPTAEQYEKWYRQIAHILGEPGQQYIAWPSSSIIQSALTMCVSGLLQWAVNFKNMLYQARGCFETILVTGDGSAGVCRHLVSYYICDMLYEAITCIVQRFGAGGQSRVGFTGGFGGFFAAVGDASRGITAEAQSRYGDRNLFSTVFASESLAHDVCMAFIYGEVPIDFGQVFESAVYLDMNSTAWLPMPTRRWQSYNPTTGYSRYVYKVAYSVFANADIQYDLKLVCSGGGAGCEGGYDGLCDCSHDAFSGVPHRNLQTQLVPKRHGSGNCPENGILRKGEHCSDEVLFVTESPLRYDKLRLEWRSVGPSGAGPSGQGTGAGGVMSPPESLLGAVSSDISEIGGPPVGVCKFYPAQAAFRCGVDIPPHGYARFVGDPQLTKPSNQPFAEGDSRIATVMIEQTMPEDALSCGEQDCEFTKYFVIKEILNQHDAKVYPPAGSREVGERLNEDKLHMFTVFDQSELLQHMKQHEIPFEIKPEHFSARPTSVRAIEPRGGLLHSFVIGEAQPVNIKPPLAVRVTGKFSPQRSVFSYELGTYSSKGFEATGANVLCEDNEEIKGELRDNKEVTCGGFRFVINALAVRNRLETAKDEFDANMILEYPVPTASAGSGACTDNPVDWTMVLEIRNSESVDGAGYQMASGPAYDPDTGKEQRKKVKFKAVCRPSARGPSGSIEDLATMTAKLEEHNDHKGNASYGMWVRENSLGPTQSVRVGNFRWNDRNDKPGGFTLDIATTAESTVLHIDVSRIGLVPTASTKISKKGAGELKWCDDAQATIPCIQGMDYGTVMLRIRKGDPTFNFSSFSLPRSAEPPGLPEAAKGLEGEWETIILNADKRSDDQSRFGIGLETSVQGTLKIQLNEQEDAIALRLNSQGQTDLWNLGIYYSKLPLESSANLKVFGTDAELDGCGSAPCIARRNDNALFLRLPADISTGDAYFWIGASGKAEAEKEEREAPASDDAAAGMEMYGRPCTGDKEGVCLTRSYCEDDGWVKEGICGENLVCCNDPKAQGSGTACGPMLGDDLQFGDAASFIGLPKCEKFCPQGTVPYKSGAECQDQCCVAKVRCSSEPDPVLIQLTERRASEGVEKMTTRILRADGDEAICGESGEGMDQNICLPGVTDDPGSDHYGECLPLNNDEVLKKYCRWMTGMTCKAEEGIASEFYAACDEQGLVTWLCKCKHEEKGADVDCTAPGNDQTTEGWDYYRRCRDEELDCWAGRID